jgi:hypothetical protein
MAIGSGAATLGAASVVGFVPGGQGSVPTQQLGVGYGTFICNGVTPVTVADANITATSLILVALLTVGGTVGAIPVPQTKTAGTGFTILGTASDTSVYAYIRIG